MKLMEVVAAALVVVGALNWGLVAVARFDLVATLQRVLTYQVVPGQALAADVVKVGSAKAVSGDSLPITVSGNAVIVGKAQVVKTDIAASNGVIHMIDTVLLPPGE